MKTAAETHSLTMPEQCFIMNNVHLGRDEK